MKSSGGTGITGRGRCATRSAFKRQEESPRRRVRDAQLRQGNWIHSGNGPYLLTFSLFPLLAYRMPPASITVTMEARFNRHVCNSPWRLASPTAGIGTALSSTTFDDSREAGRFRMEDDYRHLRHQSRAVLFRANSEMHAGALTKVSNFGLSRHVLL